MSIVCMLQKHQGLLSYAASHGVRTYMGACCCPSNDSYSCYSLGVHLKHQSPRDDGSPISAAEEHVLKLKLITVLGQLRTWNCSSRSAAVGLGGSFFNRDVSIAVSPQQISSFIASWMNMYCSYGYQ